MKLSNEKILNDSAKLSEISKKELPVKVSYAIAKNIAKLEAELKIYNVEREKLIEKYSQKDSEGKTIIGENNQVGIQKEYLAEWNKDIQELLAIENEVAIHTFPIEALDGFNMTASELMAIDYMIIEE
jgi:hypothetical protein